MNYEDYEINLYLLDLADYVEGTTVLKNYIAMLPEKKTKYIEKVVIDICLQTAPMRNYGISKEFLRGYVREILDELVARSSGGVEVIDEGKGDYTL